MTASTVHNASDHSDSAYELACWLVETELGGRRITADPAEPGGHPAMCVGPTYFADRDNTVEA
ncbi:hypothetical protein [Amycolatopsis sp. CA-128772]|uniref:hypothetical protein n=1 Tax=Amycolatopsis sp. CA-128772 TaxID=2073159 RepID=UPI000CD0B954|nr:hypothetical protein [Amycolatopsis sp. CA-128772]